MAKFIIEVSDGYILERADVTNIIEAGKKNPDFAKSLVEIISFTKIASEIKDGNNEFHVSSKDFTDETSLELFNRFMLELASTYLVGGIKGKEVEKEAEVS